MPVQRADRLSVLPGFVLGFMGIFQRGLPKRFHAEEYPDAAGLFHQRQQVSVPGNLHAGLSQPPFFERDHGFQQLADIRPVRGQVVVPEPDQLPLPPMFEAVVTNVRDHVFNRSHSESGVQGGDGAKGTMKWTSARGLHNPFDKKAIWQEVVPRRGDIFQFLRDTAVDWFEFPPPGIFEQLVPDRLCLADHERIEVTRCFLFRICNVRPPSHDKLAT